VFPAFVVNLLTWSRISAPWFFRKILIGLLNCRWICCYRRNCWRTSRQFCTERRLLRTVWPCVSAI